MKVIIIIFSIINCFCSMADFKKSLYAPYAITSWQGPSSYNNCYRFELRPGDCFENENWSDCNTGRERAEVREAWNLSKEKKKFYKFSIMLPFGRVDYELKQIFAQWHNKVDGPSLSLRVHRSKVWLDLQLEKKLTTQRFDLPSFENGRMYEFEVRVNWDKKNGSIVLLRDKEKIIEYSGATIGAHLPQNTIPVFSVGIYRSHLFRLKKKTYPPVVSFACVNF